MFGKKNEDEKIRKANVLIDAYNEAISNSQWRDVIKYGKKVVKIFKKIGNKEQEANCYGYLGDAYGNLGDSKKALEYHTKAFKTIRGI